MKIRAKFRKKFKQSGRFLFSGDLTLFGGLSLPDTIAGRIRAEQISMVTRCTCAMMGANAFNACVLLFTLWDTPQRATTTLWAFALISYAMYVYLRRRASQSRPKPTSLSARAMQRAVLNAAIMGSIWAAMPLLLFENAGVDGRLVIICLCIVMLCSGAFALASVPLAAIAVLMPISFSAGYAIVRVDSQIYLLVAGLLVVYTFALLRGVVTYACQSTEKAVDHILNEQAAYTDSLTKLPNRLAFREKLEAALVRCQRYGEGFSVFYFDLDEFKLVNDSFGHSGGDELLMQAAERLQSCTREGDTMARLAGDEFALLAARAVRPEQAMVVAERILKAFSAAFAINGRQIYASISMGIALVPIDGTSPEVVLEKADSALYATKQSGRASYTFFAREHDERVRDRRIMEQQLRTAVRNNEMQLAFQPVMDLATDTICGFEALARWNHAERGAVSPAVFIPLAEEIGVIQELGEWVLREAIRVASHWPPHIGVAINVSGNQFRSAGLVASVSNALTEFSFPAHRLEIEITETMKIAENELALTTLNTFREWGVQIALDDFGTGYSSLRYVLDLPLDKIKIDRSFIGTALERKVSASLVKAVVGIARDLNLTVTAEGVETVEQLDFIRSQNCTQGQGFLISRPLPADAIDGFLAAHGAPPLRLAS